MKNTDIRSEIKTAGLYLWQIADALGINDGNFSRKLRHELSDEEKARTALLLRNCLRRGRRSNGRSHEISRAGLGGIAQS